MSDLTSLIDDHLVAYADPDASRRSTTVQPTWADSGQLIDPPLAATGQAGIVQQAAQL